MGFVIGAGADLAVQVATNRLQGKGAFDDISLRSAGISGLAGLASGGIGILAKVDKIGKLGAAASGIGIATTESLTKQATSKEGFGKLDEVIVQTTSDVVMGEIGGGTKLFKEANINVKARKADRASRISKNDPKSSGRQATANKTESSLDRANNTNDFVGGAAGNSTQNISDESRKSLEVSGRSQISISNNQIRRDNTRINLPIQN